VLYELVADADAMEPAPPAPAPADPARFGGPARRLRRALRPAAGQTALAASLGLAAQLDRVDYGRPGYVI
jgi:hypothetical protein